MDKKNNDEEDEYTMMGGVLSGGKRRKTAKSNTRTDKFFYVKFIFLALVAEAYYSYNYAMVLDYEQETRIQA